MEIHYICPAVYGRGTVEELSPEMLRHSVCTGVIISGLCGQIISRFTPVPVPDRYVLGAGLLSVISPGPRARSLHKSCTFVQESDSDIPRRLSTPLSS